MIRFTRQQIVDFITKEEMGMSSIFIHDKNRAEISFVDGSFDSCEIVEGTELSANDLSKYVMNDWSWKIVYGAENDSALNKNALGMIGVPK